MREASPPLQHVAARARRVHGLPRALWALAAVVCTGIWVLVPTGVFWPGYVWVGVYGAVALDEVRRRDAARRRAGEPPAERALAAHGELSIAAVGVYVAVWALGGAGVFWPVWPLGGGAAIYAAHAIVVRSRRPPAAERERLLAERVARLEQTRRGALDVQAAELRRIERDLHDGAQARLVALTMKLGRAEARLEEDSEAAALLREARDDATAAIAELRDLARGIAPPVLADRGLLAAVEALADRTPVAVDVRGSLARRPVPVVEAAAYFVVAEALTNVAKHAPDARAEVRVAQDGDRLVVEVRDDGPGGAVPTGNGLSGLRQRVDALDGTLEVGSPSGGPTTIRAVLPCGS